MGTNIPPEAAGPVCGVLIYSVACLSLSVLLYVALIAFQEYTNYITLFCGFISISTAASIIQQVEFAVNWKHIKERQFEEATSQPQRPLPMTHVYGMQAVLYWIQYYCYNVEALLLLFWAINLGKRMWNIRNGQHKYDQVLWSSILAKLSAVIIPGILMGIVQLNYVLERRTLLVILGNACLELSLAIGSVVIIVSLIEFFVYRRTFKRNQNNSSCERIFDTTNSPCAMEDRWIIFRFITAFIILSVFEVWIVVFQILQSDTRNELALAKDADLSMDGIKSDLLSFIPGVTASAGCFILFGTTAPLRKKYRSWFGFLAPSRLCTCCLAGERKHRQGQGQPEQSLHEMDQRSMAELALSSARIRAGTTENNFGDVWPENPNFTSNHFISSPSPMAVHRSAEFNYLTAGTPSGNHNREVNVSRNTIGGGGLAAATSDIAGPNPFSLVLPSPPPTIGIPIKVPRTSSTSPSLLQQQEILMRGDAVFFTPHYFKPTGQNPARNQGSNGTPD